MKRYLVIIVVLLGLCNAYSQSTNTYEYDNLNRLTKVTYANGAVAQYTYDAVGNRLTKTVAGVYGQYTITASANPTIGGAVSGAGTFNEGSSCTLTASPNSGYNFINWMENGTQVSSSASYTFTVTGNRTLVANFEEIQPNSYVVTASANPSEGGTVFGSGTYIQGSSCTLTAIPNSGYNFIHWMKNGNQVSTNATYNFTVTENGSYVAVFEQSTTTVTHNQTMVNGWNWWSTYIELTGVDGLTQLENSLGSAGLMIKSRSNGYVESYQYNGMTNWFGSLAIISNEQMYKIYTNASCSAIITGLLANTSNHPITINYGWNWIGFPLNHSVGVSEALSGFSPAVNDILKGRNGYSTFFSYNGTSGWFGTLNTLEPGCGYMYQSQSNSPKTLMFQPIRGETIVANITPENNVYQPLNEHFADNMTVTAVVEIEGDELRSDSHELAAFVDDECRGSVRLLYVEPIDRYMAFLTVFGELGDEIEFHLTDGMEAQISSDGLAYASDGVVGTIFSPKVFHFGTLSVGETSAIVRIYPNPVQEGSELRLVLPIQSGMLKLEICNVLGALVYRDDALAVLASTARLDLPASILPGTYLLKVTSQEGIVCYGKLVVD